MEFDHQPAGIQDFKLGYEYLMSSDDMLPTFECQIRSMELQGAFVDGACKVIPPEGWGPDRSGAIYNVSTNH